MQVGSRHHSWRQGRNIPFSPKPFFQHPIAGPELAMPKLRRDDLAAALGKHIRSPFALKYPISGKARPRVLVGHGQFIRDIFAIQRNGRLPAPTLTRMLHELCYQRSDWPFDAKQRDHWAESNSSRIRLMCRHVSQALRQKAARGSWLRDIFIEGVPRASTEEESCDEENSGGDDDEDYDTEDAEKDERDGSSDGSVAVVAAKKPAAAPSVAAASSTSKGMTGAEMAELADASAHEHEPQATDPPTRKARGRAKKQAGSGGKPWHCSEGRGKGVTASPVAEVTASPVQAAAEEWETPHTAPSKKARVGAETMAPPAFCETDGDTLDPYF